MKYSNDTGFLGLDRCPESRLSICFVEHTDNARELSGLLVSMTGG